MIGIGGVDVNDRLGREIFYLCEGDERVTYVSAAANDVQVVAVLAARDREIAQARI